MGGHVKSAGAMLQDTVRQSVHEAYQEALATTARLQAGWQCVDSSFGSRIDAGDVWYLTNSRSLRRCGGTQLGI